MSDHAIKAAHSHGPWHKGSAGHFSVESDVADYLTWAAVWADGQIVALVCTDQYGNDDAVDANANMIVAAPDLLTVARQAESDLADKLAHYANGDAVQVAAVTKKLENARAAIAKAEGAA